MASYTERIEIYGRFHLDVVGPAIKLMADRLGVVGELRILATDHIQVVAQGDRAAVDRLRTWCRAGPRHCLVRSLTGHTTESIDATGFRIAPQ